MGESGNNRNVGKEKQEKVGMCEYRKCEWGIGKKCECTQREQGNGEI